MPAVPIFPEGEKKNHCMKHDFPYQYWAIKDAAFYCKKCIVERDIRTAELRLLADAQPVVTQYITERIGKAKTNLVIALESLDGLLDQCHEKLTYIRKYKKKVYNLEASLIKLIAAAEDMKSRRTEDYGTIRKLREVNETIQSEVDARLVVTAKDTLDILCRPFCLPALQVLESKLCNIVCSYMNDEEQFEIEGISPSRDETKPCVLSSDHSRPEFLLHDCELEEEKFDSNNKFHSVLLHLRDQAPPNLLKVHSNHNAMEAVAQNVVTSVASTAKDCRVFLNLYHSFYKPKQHSVDREFLDYFLNSPRLCIFSFYGYLDAAGIAKLPKTVNYLGLAINTATDSIAVSGLKPWTNLRYLDISVSNVVSTSDLKELPIHVKCRTIHFPGLTDARVDGVRLSIVALAPNRKFNNLAFPLCQLSRAGIYSLMQQFRNLDIDNVAIELCGSWHPNSMEKQHIQQELVKFVPCCYICWDLEWLFFLAGECFFCKGKKVVSCSRDFFYLWKTDSAMDTSSPNRG